jgi:hypothetical protein
VNPSAIDVRRSVPGPLAATRWTASRPCLGVPLASVLLLVAAGMIAGCSGSGGAAGGSDRSGDTMLSADAGDVGEDWAADGRSGRSGGRGGAMAGRSSSWSVLLQAFPASRGSDQAAAMELLRRMQPVDPRLRQAFIHTDSRGSMVLFGRHGAADDASAQADLAFIKEIRLGGQPLFPRAMLTRIRVVRDPSTIGPMELLSTRLANPEVRELFTFQVAVWGTFREYADRGQRTPDWDEVRRRAEAQVRDLRSRGYQAYYHHDDDKQLSMITIGVFDRTAFDAQAGLYLHPMLERLAREFTQHLVNGEPVVMRKAGQEIPQQPLLVMVPELP